MARKRLVFFDQLHSTLIRKVRFVLIAILMIAICVSMPAIAMIPPNLIIQVSNSLQIGKELYDAGRFTEAIPVLKQAIQQAQQQNQPLQQAIALSNLSLTYQKLGDWTAATAAIEQSLKLIETSSNTTEHRKILAQSLQIQASLQMSIGQAEAALDSLQRSEKLHLQLNDQDSALRDRIQQAQALQALGFYRRALNLLNASTTTLHTQSNSVAKVVGLRSLGDALRSVGELQQSERVLLQSLKIAESLKAPTEIAATLLSLGNTVRQDNPTRAIQFYQQAAQQTTSPQTRVRSQLNQLNLQVIANQQTEVNRLTAEILPQLESLSPSRSTVYAKVNLAQSLMKLDCEKAHCRKIEVAKILAQAVEQARSLKDSRAESYATGSLAQLYERDRQFQPAQLLTEKALLLSREIDAADLAYQWQWQLGRLFKQQGQVNQAIPSYLAAVQSLQSLRNDLAVTNREVQFSFRDSVEPVYRQAVELLLQAPTQDHLKQARSLIESLQLAELDNFFREACINTQTVLLDQVVDRQSTKAAVIYSIVAQNQLNLVLKLPDQPDLQFYSVPNLPIEQVRSTVTELRQKLVDPSALREIQKLSNQVYGWMMAEIEPTLQKNQVKTLVFVLDGDLRSIPMSALYDGEKFLMQKYAIALSPGLQLLTPQPLSSTPLKALAAGLVNPPPEFQDLSPLPGIETEFALMTEVGVPTRKLLNDAFRSRTLEQEINTDPYSIVHLATHGRFSSKLEETFILAADGRIGVNQLGELLRSRGQSRTEAIELLVLSACETAAGDNRATLGLAGVALKSGARSTVASLWTVEDDSTAQFVGEFYKGLKAKLTKAEALQQAQQTLFRQNPRYVGRWAAYVLIGNWL